MIQRKAKKKTMRIAKRRGTKKLRAAKKTKPRAKATRGFAIHTGKPTGREVQAQVLTERYIAEGLTPADAQTRAREELRASPRKD
jgi:hypothetical protein